MLCVTFILHANAGGGKRSTSLETVCQLFPGVFYVITTMCRVFDLFQGQFNFFEVPLGKKQNLLQICITSVSDIVSPS